MRRLVLFAALVGLAGCDPASTPTIPTPPTDDEPQVEAAVVIVGAVRGRQGTNVWYITPDLENEGGPGEFYIHAQGVSLDPEGPLTECGLTQKISVPAYWRDRVDYVIECPRAPQFLTVYTRSRGEEAFRETDYWVY
jgi:hypothetical protein